MSTAAKTNKFAGTCTCGNHVAAGAGFLGPKTAKGWTTRCATCGPVARFTARPAARLVHDGFTGEACDAQFDARLVRTGSRW